MPVSKAREAAGGKFRRPLLQGALAIAVTASAAAPVPALAQSFLKLGDIKGESVDAKHKDYIEILSFTQSFINNSTGLGGGAGAGKVQCGAITMMKNIDKSSPMLLMGVATGQYYKDGVVTFQVPGVGGARPTGAGDYYTINMTDVFINELSQTDAADPNRIFEKLVINAGTYEFKYVPTNSKGTIGEPVTFKFNCAENQSF